MRRFVRALCMCFSNFTAIPCPYRPWDEDARGLMVLCLPFVGAILGFLWHLLALLGGRLVPAARTALIVALPWLLTGFIHLDGFMDASDALLSWRPPEQRLKILKDPHAGSFSVIAMVVLALFSWGAASAIGPKDDLRALVFIPVISRCCSAFCVMTLKPLSASQYADRADIPAQRLAVLAMWAFEVLLCALWLGGSAWVLIVETLAYAAAMLWARRTLGGVSGDVAGFALSISECAALVALACRIAGAAQ